MEVAWRRRADYYAVPWRGRWATELGGVLLSQAVHAIDMLTYIAGPPTKVFARVTTRVNDIEVEDCAAISLELADGSLATITATLGSEQEITRHRFHFANLSAESGTSAYENAADPWDIHPDDDGAGRRHRRGRSTAGSRAPRAGGASSSASATGSTATPPTCRSPWPTPAPRSSSSPPCTTRPAAASTSTLPLAPDHPLYGGWLP